jgi:hypothetical protein
VFRPSRQANDGNRHERQASSAFRTAIVDAIFQQHLQLVPEHEHFEPEFGARTRRCSERQQDRDEHRLHGPRKRIAVAHRIDARLSKVVAPGRPV